jgi:alkylhydroperoxidase/carboxymuconolactone decarboxylase family protein YurZ
MTRRKEGNTPMFETTEREAHDELRREFAEVRGELTPVWEALLERDPAFFEAYLRFVQTPWRNGRVEPKHKELIMLAVYAATTHAFEPGIRLHVRNAHRHGAAADEILEVLELVSPIGSHTCIEGVRPTRRDG